MTPWILGRGMTLSPVVVLSGVLLWGALWGVPGAIMAVPLLVSLKVLCDHVPRMRSLGQLLGQ